MAIINISDEDKKLFDLFKKFNLLAKQDNKSFEDFCDIFYFAYSNDLFSCPKGSAGEIKIIRWDKDNNIRLLEIEKVLHTKMILQITGQPIDKVV